ncbi:hypothetical protein PpBr36_04849 [Pyricularia pennisetigena]|uniref:hypothetical protein n=1 Tax=Pyricularia pennisetigena TaxID=1578925 RepID=UPI001151FFBB|nr:hypothetical protein PpBr36_04849 [Pyricularia pennisetigena]TLS26933.1 hypothetical protein PpBr36_04849 [Pyricularia pennisetigena]
MHFPSILATLAVAVSTTSAINVRSHTGNSCSGEWSQCNNIAAGRCCRFSSSLRKNSISITEACIPAPPLLPPFPRLFTAFNPLISYTARIRGEAYRDDGCSTFAGSELSRGANWICIPYTNARPGRRTGGRWYNSSTRRRSNVIEEDKTCPAEQYVEEGECTTYVMPDVFGLADGTTFNITGLDVEKVEELEKLAVSGAAIDAMPAEFQALRSSDV